MNTPIFMDLAEYLQSQHSDDPQKLFDALMDVVQKTVSAQSVIDQMLKTQAKQQSKQ